MTAERFGELLRRPYLLSGQNATELEELIAAYPWCGALRRLRYQKALIDGDTAGIAAWRVRAAPFLSSGASTETWLNTPDDNPARANQHFQFEQNPPTRVASDSASAINASESSASESRTSESRTSESRTSESRDSSADSKAGESINLPTALPGSETSRQESALELRPASTPDLAPALPTAPEQQPRLQLQEALVAAATAVYVAEWYLQRNGLIMEYGRPSPAPIEALRSFREWKQRRAQTSWQDLLQLGLEERPSGKTSKAKRSSEPAEPEVASETLADLLAAQGHHDKALRMYEQLALRFPHKMATFAARIQALQHTQV